jgi:MYXO-CTERM domain-containing protein
VKPEAQAPEPRKCPPMQKSLGLGVAFVLALALAGSSAAASTTQENQAKYTHLRQRLNTQYVKVGAAPGESVPAEVRHEAQGFIKFADATLNHGWYLGILATEYHLRTHLAVYPGADNGDANAATKTLDELYFALNALERMDNVADASFPAPCTTTASKNGFFLRDDVPAGFHLHFPPLTSLQSDFVDPVLTNKEMSQDQVYHLLLGLALVKHLVPASVMTHGKAPRAWAAEQARRIGENFAKDSWVIKNPACGGREVNRGGKAIGYSSGTCKAFAFISDGAYVPTTQSLWDGIWDTLKSPTNPAYNDPDNLHMGMAIAAVGNGWGATTADDLLTLTAKEDWPLYSLAHRVLHGKAADNFCKNGAAVNTRARVMIDELPKDGEPACPLPGPPAAHGFTTNHRFTRPKSQHYVGAQGAEGQHFSGTDYMLLHNLYAIATPASWMQGPSVAPCAGFVEGTPPGDAGVPSDSGSSGGSSSGSSGSSTSGSAGEGAAPDDAASPSGCACDLGAEGASSKYALLVVPTLLGLVLRRRRR